MFRAPPSTSDNTPKYIYLHKLERLYDNRPIILAQHSSVSLRRRLFLLKRWRDERITYLYESFRDLDYMADRILQKLLLHIKRLKRLIRKNHNLRISNQNLKEQKIPKIVGYKETE